MAGYRNSDDLPQTLQQLSPEKAQVITMPGEGSQLGTGKVQRQLCHSGHYSKAILHLQI